MSQRNLRSQDKPDYVSMHNGLCSGEEGASQTTPPPAPPVSSLFNEPRPGSPKNDIAAEVDQLTARKLLLEEAERQEVIEDKRDELRRQVEALESRSKSRSAKRAASRAREQHSASSVVKPAANRVVVNQPQPQPFPLERSTCDINLRDLRDLSALSSQVDAELTRAGVRDYVEPAQLPQQTLQGKNQFKSTNSVSGKEARVRDSIIHALTWPHTALTFSYISKNIDYNKLDFPLLVAGELSIIRNRNISDSERWGRMQLLERTAYHSKDYTWGATLSFHEAVLVEIERGVRSWESSDYRDIETGTLFRHPITSQPTARSDYTRPDTTFKKPTARRFFCLNYNKGECHHQNAHDGIVGRANQLVEHFCAACFRTEHIIRLHPEISCTYKHK